MPAALQTMTMTDANSVQNNTSPLGGPVINNQVVCETFAFKIISVVTVAGIRNSAVASIGRCKG